MNGKRSYPATALVCNFSKPTREKPSLLKHMEVWLLFHELGHGIHDLVSKTKYARFHGTMTAQDFCEAPSQMLENWCWDPVTLRRLSQHYSTVSSEYLGSWENGKNDETVRFDSPGERMPEDMMQSLIRSRNANKATFWLRALHVSIFDMMIHQPGSHEIAERINTSVLWNTLQKDILGLEGPETHGGGDEWGHMDATFPHLMGDYDAGYYGYLSSQVYASDMFHTFFKSNPMSRAEGRRYRTMILEKGGSEDEMAMLSKYLGRPPSMEAFDKELGLS